MERGGRRKVPPLAEEQLIVAGRGRISLFKIDQPHSSGRPNIQECIYGQHKVYLLDQKTKKQEDNTKLAK